MLRTRGWIVNRAYSLSTKTLALLATLACSGRAQRSDSPSLSGVVYDSIGRRPLADASIQFVSSGGGPRASTYSQA